MFAATAVRIDADDPLSGLELGERPEPAAPDGWTTVTVKAAALNHHDVWTLRGVGISEDRLPIVLGCDAAGLDEDGNEVVVHAVIADPDAGGGDETLDPRRSLLSERYDGAFAERVCVPRRNLVPKPAALSFEEAACLPTAYLTAYKMLFEKSGVQPGATLLVQGAGGGVATALIVLGRAAGYRIWATSRSEAKRERALKLGADQVFPSGARLPERVDVVLETVGQATWAHSRTDPGVLHAAVGDRLDDGVPRSARPADQVPRADRRPPGHRPGAAAGAGARRLPGHDRRRPVRQDRLHPLEGQSFPVGFPASPAGGVSSATEASAEASSGESAVEPAVPAVPGPLPSASSWPEPGRKISDLIRSSASSRIVRRSLITFSPADEDCMATRRRSEVNWTASRSRSRRVPKSRLPGQPGRPRIRAQSSQPRRPGQSVQPGPWPHPGPPGESQS